MKLRDDNKLLAAATTTTDDDDDDDDEETKLRLRHLSQHDKNACLRLPVCL